MKKIKGTLVFELAVGQCAAIVEENNPNQVLRTSQGRNNLQHLCGLPRPSCSARNHGSEYELLVI